MPRLISEIRHRLRALLHRRAMDTELDEELRFHLEREIRKLTSEGKSPAEAARIARARFGAFEGIKDDARDARGITLFEHFVRDLRFAFRSLRLRKAMTIGVVLTLGLGIGVNVTMFGIVDRLLFRAPAGLRDPATVHRLIRHRNSFEVDPRIDRNFSFATYLDIAKVHSLEKVAAFQTRRLAVGEGQDVQEVPVTVASATYFDFFEVVPAQGRFFTQGDDAIPAGSAVTVLGYEFWQARFGGEKVVGKTLRIDRELWTIIGVAPRGFTGVSDQGVPGLYLPITHYAYSLRGERYPQTYNWSWLELVARRRADVSRESAEAELTNGFVQSWRNAAVFDKGWGDPAEFKVRGELAPMQIARSPDAGPESKVATWILGVGFIVLLIACSNVANLFLSRAVSRRAELGMRAALGASRGRIIAQVLSESLLLALLGGVTGMALAQVGASGLRAWFLPPDLAVGVLSDTRTVVFTLIITLVVTLLTGLIPAWYAARLGTAGSLRVDGRSGQQRSGLRSALLVIQPALCMILLVGAVLFVRSFRHVRDYRLGYDVEPVALGIGNLRGTQLSEAARKELTERMLVAAQTTPGVRFATLAASIPFWGNEGRGLFVPGVDSVNKLGRFILQAGTPDYFRTMGTRILRGRSFDEGDRATAPPVVVVSEGMARVIWPNQEAIGRCIRIGEENAPCATVVGIAEDTRIRLLTDAREYAYYLPAAQYDGGFDPIVLARVDGAGKDFVTQLQSRLQSEMPGQAYVRAIPLSALVSPTMRSWRFGATLFVAFGGLALVVAAVGLYSVMSYDVARRTRELGVRIAMGASVARILSGVLSRGGRLVGLGVLTGGTVAVLFAPKLEKLLFRQPPRDPVVFIVVAIGLLAVSLVASMAPALRAARVNPTVALRAE